MAKVSWWRWLFDPAGAMHAEQNQAWLDAAILPPATSSEPDQRFMDEYFDWEPPERWFQVLSPKLLEWHAVQRGQGNRLVGVAYENRRSPNLKAFYQINWDTSTREFPFAEVCNESFQMATHDLRAARAAFLQTGVIALRVDRDSVCMGDDVGSHEAYFGVKPETRVSELVIRLMQDEIWLARIQGGCATWQVEQHDGNSIQVLGIAAEQWDQPKLLARFDVTCLELFPQGVRANLFFRYLAQLDPDRAFRRL